MIYFNFFNNYLYINMNNTKKYFIINLILAIINYKKSLIIKILTY